jgi:hypothetical protein
VNAIDFIAFLYTIYGMATKRMCLWIENDRGIPETDSYSAGAVLDLIDSFANNIYVFQRTSFRCLPDIL